MITLASTSMARAAMLRAAGVLFTIKASLVDEKEVKKALLAEGAIAEKIADTLAETKAVKVSCHVPGLVLGADQLLITKSDVLVDKPDSREAALAQLTNLSNSEHRLVSSAVIAEDGVAVWRASDTARLSMRPLSSQFIADYFETEGNMLLDCVGAYRIEGLGAQLFSKVSGDPFVIQGLPLLPILAYLRVRGELAT